MDADGRKCTKEAPGAKWVESRFYTVQIFIDGKPKLVKGYTDKAASAQMGAKMEREKAQGEQGLQDIYKSHRRRTITEHIAEWVAELVQLGRDDAYIAPCKARMERLAKECGWGTLGAISADSFCKWRETAMTNAAHNRKDRSKLVPALMASRSKNHYLITLRTFCRWCIKRKRIGGNPVADVEKVEESGDVRRERRALTAEELQRLLVAIPEHYRLGYQMLMGTGLRRGELLALRWGDVRLNAPHPFIQLRAATTKSKRADALPLREDLAAVLRKAKGDDVDADRVVKVLPRIPTHQKYLAGAGIAWLDDAGRRADIHCLRHSYGTLLSKGGVSPREAMSLMRHTDMRLTMKVYTDPRIFDLTGAVEKLPMNFCTQTNHQAAQATGTDGKASEPNNTSRLPNDTIIGGDGRSESVSSPSAGLGNCLATIGNTADGVVSTISPLIGGDWQQKTPSGGDGVKERAMGVEPTTFGLESRCSAN